MRRINIRITILIALYLIVSIFLSFIPLFNYLGYEFSFVIALFAFTFSGPLAITSMAKTPNDLEIPDFLKKRIHKIILRNLALLIIPFIVICINAFFVRNCSFINGIIFFLLIPVVTVIFSVSLGFFVFALFKRKRKIWFFLIGFLIILNSILTYYFYPQTFLYNPIFGYFSSMVYDEEMAISINLILYRISTLIESGILFYAGSVIIKRSKVEDSILKKLALLKNLISDYKYSFLLIVTLILFWFFENELHIVSSENYIQKRLGGKYSTEHFEIFYPASTFNDEEISRIALLHEYYFNSIEKELKTGIKKKVKSYIYSSLEEKRDLIGAKFTNYAKPWLYQIHVNSNILDEVLKHELVHIIAGEFALPIAKVGLNVGLIEGIAMAIEWDWGSRTLHQYCSMLQRMGLLIDMDEIMTMTGFLGRHSNYGYIQSGSFCRFLIDKYGVENMKSVYAKGNFESVYKKKLTDLNGEWKEFLKTIKIEAKDSSLIKYLFLRPSIFQKVCARVIANMNELASNEYSSKNYEKASKIYQESLNLSFNNEAQQGIILAFFQMKNYDSVIAITDRIFEKQAYRDAFILLKMQRGDAYWIKSIKENRTDLLDSAKSNYEFVSNLNINDNYNFASNCRLEFLKYPGVYEKVIDYYVYKKDEFIKAAILKDIINLNPEIHFVKIVLGRNLFTKAEYTEAMIALNMVNDNNISEYFSYEKYHLLGLCSFHLKDYTSSKMFFQKAMEYQKNEADIVRLNEWIEKCAFYKNALSR